MRNDKKSEFLKALKRDRVEEHENESHAGQEKVVLFAPIVDPAIAVFRRTITTFYFVVNSCLHDFVYMVLDL